MQTGADPTHSQFTCPPNALGQLTAAVAAPGSSSELLASELVYTALQRTPPDPDLHSKISDLVDALEENEDTLRVWTTLDTRTSIIKEEIQST